MVISTNSPTRVTTGEQTTLAPLTADAVAKQTDAGSFKRGRAYARSGHIFAAIRRENSLRARCHGSSGGPYLVTATLAESDKAKRNPIDYACNCPRGGFCKHVVALLLTWIERPGSFDVRPPLVELLSGKSQEELIGLIERLLRDNPELERIIELPPPITGTPDDRPVDEGLIRRQIAAALRDVDRSETNNGYDFYGHYDEYEYEGTQIARALEPLIVLTDAYVDGGHWANGYAVAATLVEEVAEEMEFIDDGNGDLALLFERAYMALATCLESQAGLPTEQRLSDEERVRLINALVTSWQTSIESDYLDLGDEGLDAIARYASIDEQRIVRDRLRAYMASPAADDWHKATRTKVTLWFLSQLTGDAGLSPEELLIEYRNAELWDDAAQTLLQLGRIEEAMALAARHLNARELITFADQLADPGDPQRVEHAVTIIDDRCWEREGKNAQDDQLLLEWLERRYAQLGQPQKAFEIAQRRFKHAPSTTTYAAVRAAAHLPGLADDAWSKLRPELIAAIAKRGHWTEIIDLHLAEEEVGDALKALEKSKKGVRKRDAAWDYRQGVVPEHCELRVATAAEKAFPEEAIRIYQRLAEQRIGYRERANYQAAATYLVRVMNLLEGIERGEDWKTYISELREKNKSLRTLREELDSLGLT